ncbi:unnamed protein product, partial [Prorocentrum cordatum]
MLRLLAPAVPAHGAAAARRRGRAASAALAAPPARRCVPPRAPQPAAPAPGVRARASVATLDEVLDAAQEAGSRDDDASAVPGGGKGAAAQGAAPAARARPSVALKVAAQQGVLWFANVYPTKAFRFDFRQVLTHHNHETLIPTLLPEGVEVLRMVPREREGGAFVYFRAPPSFVLQVLLRLGKKGEGAKQTSEDVDILLKVCEGITGYLKNHDVRAFLSPFPVRAHRVRGEPYLEDLMTRYPSSRLRVRLEPPSAGVGEEQLYQNLRRYGQLDDLTTLPDGKGFRASFTYTAGAVAARNCLHRSYLSPAGGGPAVRLHFEYEPFMQKWLREQITSNARYSVSLLVFCTLGMTYLIWDPLRALSVQLRVAGSLLHAPGAGPPLGGAEAEGAGADRLRLSGARGWLLHALSGAWMPDGWAPYTPSRMRASRALGASSGILADFWADRPEELSELRHWLTQPQDKLMLLTGCRGNGQEAIVAQLVGGRAVLIDVGEMLEAGGGADDQIFLRIFCKALGYWPAQGMDRQMSALLELMLPGSGKLSRENELIVAVQRILSCVTQALIDWKNRRALGGQQDAAMAAPLFVVSGFTAENRDRREGFFSALVKWGAYMSEAGLARVLFIADSSFAEPAMLGELSNRPERLDVTQLQDADPGSVRQILRRQIGDQGASSLTDAELAAIGGRFRDIASLVNRVRSGDDPKQAVRHLVEAAETTVRTLLMVGQPGVQWTRPQLWRAVRMLESSPGSAGNPGVVPYDVFLWGVFRGDEVALRSM